MWADGICINQSDFEEKNRQVGLMSVIYEVASHTIIFLGETTSETDKMFRSLLRPISSSLTKQIKSGILSNVRASHDTDTFDLESKEEIESIVHDLVRHILDMPWFRRIWILQELVLSCDPWVQVGTNRLKWKNFTSLIFESNSKHDSAWAKSPNYDVLDEMCTLRESFVSRTSESSDPCHYLLKILHSCRGYGVSDPRDMLYGHLAMFANHTKSKDPKIEKFIEIDYRKTRAEFEFLSRVEDVDFEERKWDLPTWVPDWTSNKVSMEPKWRLQKGKTISEIHGIRDIHIVLGEKAVLGCIGTRVNCVEMVKNEIPRREDVFALCHKIKKLSAMEGSRENEYFDDRKMFVRLVCEHFCAWFNTSETSPYNFIPDHLEKLFDHRRSEANFRFHEIIYSISATADPANLEPLKNYLEVLKYHNHPQELGKKLAVLGNGKIALVSVRVEAGDEVWRFDGENEGPCYVFRGYDDEEGAGRIEMKETGEENGGRAEMDRTFEAFFRKMKRQVMERYVECRDDGRIAWNKKISETNGNMGFMGESAYKTISNSLARAARVLAKLESEVNDDGKREREKELKENLKRNMEMVVGNVLQEMHEMHEMEHHYLSDARVYHDQNVMLLRTDVVGIAMDRGVVKHVRFLGECVFDDESKHRQLEDKKEYWIMSKEENWIEKKCQEVEEEMKKWWKLGLGIPSEDLHDEREYDEGEYDEGYEVLGYDLEGWEPE
ncbi:hypothetical protein EAF00_009083 [Botryotinia globosa]|nr:hypothetical protein EAF00_009083 [Botryotinia globosa]